VDRVVSPVDTSDGAGVSLKRSIGGPKIPNLDPFLLLDEFKSDDPSDYEAGFPEHPHRGFETVTIMLHGSFKHQDSRGNTGFLTSGGVQWMTAGKGVLHSETPMQADGLMWGYQLWVNLPAREKMKDPRYQDIDASKIPAIELGDTGVVARLIAGKIGSVNGAVDGIPVDPLLMDVMVPANGVFEFPVVAGHTLFVYTVEGNVTADGIEVPASRIILFNADGYSFKITASPTSPSRLLVVAGAPIKEPIARHGPFVMNTREEIIQCFIDLQNGKLA
jgi:hypothetical protein